MGCIGLLEQNSAHEVAWAPEMYLLTALQGESLRSGVCGVGEGDALGSTALC